MTGSRKLNCAVVTLVAGASLMMSNFAAAADVAMVSGLFKSEETKVDGSNAGGKSQISVGGRYHEDLGSGMAWFGHGALNLKNYKSGKDTKAPDNTVGLDAGGGVRWYFTPFSASAVPFASAMGYYHNGKDVQPISAASYVEKESSGLYYAGSGGVRIGMDSRYWIELEAVIFNSALYATEKEVTTTVVNGQEQTSKKQTTRTELFVESFAPLTSTLVSFGMKL